MTLTLYGNKTSEYAVLQAILAMREDNNTVNFIDYVSVIILSYELRQVRMSYFEKRLLKNEIFKHL